MDLSAACKLYVFCPAELKRQQHLAACWHRSAPLRKCKGSRGRWAAARWGEAHTDQRRLVVRMLSLRSHSDQPIRPSGPARNCSSADLRVCSTQSKPASRTSARNDRSSRAASAWASKGNQSLRDCARCSRPSSHCAARVRPPMPASTQWPPQIGENRPIAGELRRERGQPHELQQAGRRQVGAHGQVSGEPSARAPCHRHAWRCPGA